MNVDQQPGATDGAASNNITSWSRWTSSTVAVLHTVHSSYIMT